MQGQMQEKRTHSIDWSNVRHHFLQSTYIGIVWDWFLVLTAKLADPFLLLSILYAGFKVTNPDLASHVWSGIDAGVNIGQNIALDAAGFGLLAMATQAEKDGNGKGATQARGIGYTLLAMMVVNMGLASLARSFGWQEQSYAWLVGVLLIARAVLSVAYGVISRSLRKSESKIESEETINAVSVLERVGQIESALKHFETMQGQHFDRMTESVLRVEDAHQKHTETLARLEKVRQASDQASNAHMNAQPVKPTRVKTPRSTASQPTLPLSSDFDKRRFVFACLKENPDMKISEIQERALKEGQKLSVGTISSYRKAYDESNSVGMTETESTEMHETEEGELA